MSRSHPAQLDIRRRAVLGRSDSGAPPPGTSREWAVRVAVLVGSLCLACLPALLGRGVVEQATALYELGAGANPYAELSHALLLRVAAPVALTSGFLLFLAPGALAVLACASLRGLSEWLVLSFGASTVLVVGLFTAAKLMLGTPLSPSLSIGLWMGVTLVATVALAWRLRRPALPVQIERGEGRRAVAMLSASFLLSMLLVPKIFWESFNLDGIEAFEFGRSLAHHVLPHWAIFDGAFGFYQNFVLFAYPNHWFIMLFGPVEASVRAPFVLYVVLLFPALLLLIEQERAERLSIAEEGAVWLTLGLFIVVQAFNTGYEPFFADLAENAATDTLAILSFLLACYALWSERPWWFVTFAVMTYTASPGGLLLLLALAGSTVAAHWPGTVSGPRRVALAVALAVCLLLALAYELLYAPLVLAEGESQFSGRNLLGRLYPPSFTSWVRWNALLFPSGILPALSLPFVKRPRDRLGWVLAGVTVIYFGVLYLQAWTSLHQFTPVMILPVAVFWRLYLKMSRRARRLMLSGVVVSVLVSLFVSLPRHFRIDLQTRRFGQATSYLVGEYESDYEAIARAGWSLSVLLPEDYRLEYPNQPWGTDAYAWIYYATRPKSPSVEINYVVQPAAKPPPTGAERLAQRDGTAVYVHDLGAWRQDRVPRLPRVVMAPVYEPILRNTYELFRAYAARHAAAAVDPGRP